MRGMTSTPIARAACRTLLLLALALGGAARPARAQSFVEYPAHPATYGDHTIAATWAGGPTSVSLQFFSDEAILHADGNGQSQRTARNTLTHVAPSAPTNPQDYDDLRLETRYGARLPLLQEMAANGTCTLRYQFAAPVAGGLNLFVTDVDDADSVVVRAFAAGGAPLDMAAWALVARGDLSLYKNTGAAYSTIVAPLPVTTFAAAGVVFVAADHQNYNRSYAVLAPPAGQAVDHIDITFTGHQNSASRADAGTGSHVYVALSTPLAGAAAPTVEPPGFGLAVTPNPARRGAPLTVDYDLRDAARVRLLVLDVAGRRVALVEDALVAGGAHRARWNGTTMDGRPAPAGLYFVALELEGRIARTRRVMLAP